jgi:hypothetical protein
MPLLLQASRPAGASQAAGGAVRALRPGRQSRCHHEKAVLARSRGLRLAVPGVAVLVLAADQISKSLVVAAGPATVAAWGQSARWATRASFGIGAGHPLLITLTAATVLAVTLALLACARSRAVALSLAAVTGALSATSPIGCSAGPGSAGAPSPTGFTSLAIRPRSTSPTSLSASELPAPSSRRSTSRRVAPGLGIHADGHGPASRLRHPDSLTQPPVGGRKRSSREWAAGPTSGPSRDRRGWRQSGRAAAKAVIRPLRAALEDLSVGAVTDSAGAIHRRGDS